MSKVGFDNDKYLEEQKKYILERVEKVDGKLYLECGGKLLFDYHAQRVLPGFDTNDKMKVFQSFKDKLDVIICIHAGDIEHRKMRSDFGISYDTDVFKMIDDFASWGIKANKVVITRYTGEKSVNNFADMLTRRGVEVYFHKPIMGYPDNVDMVVSDEGYGSNPYIPTERPVVIVTAPGPGSGKLATCLSQVYHDYRAGRKAGYAKFESFPIWNLPIDHPVNIAYEAATADIGDYNQIDHFYVSATGKIAVNYNRDMEAYPLLKRILDKITNGQFSYNSPTDMGVNRLGFGICDDEVVREAAKQEIVRRYYRSACEYAQGIGTKESVQRSYDIMTKAGLCCEDRPTVSVAKKALEDAIERGKSKDGIACAAAIQLNDGRFVTAHNSPMMHASSALILNSLKVLAGIDKKVDLIHHDILDNVTAMKRDVLRGRGISLNLDEALICLAMSAAINSDAKKALDMLPQLRGCESHMSHIPSAGDSTGLRKLGINVTSEPMFPSNNMRNF
ncbi:MAG: DUF1846 domain-containing protein [Sphaerochaetaceae bacterium]|nr:DUF1846 domain-containing protein [Sphaerochaetaceae bacterium]